MKKNGITSYPDHVDVTLDDSIAYRFHFYQNKQGRFVALSNTVGCSEYHGEGHVWWAAMSNCIDLILKNKGK